MPATSTIDRPRLEASFVAALGPLRQSLRRGFDLELTGHGLSSALASPLVRIRHQDGIRQRELAQQLDIEGPTLVRLLDQLEAAGLVTRRPDPADHRAKTLHVTRAGEALARRILPVIERFRGRVLADVGDAELATCVHVLERLLAAADV